MPKRTNSSLMLRDLLGLTQQQLADLLHVSREQISKIENETRVMPSELLAKTGYWERVFYFNGQQLNHADTLHSEELELQEIQDFRREEHTKASNQVDKLRKQLARMEEDYTAALATVHMIRAYFILDKPNMEATFSRQLLGIEALAMERMKKSGKLAQFKLWVQLEHHLAILSRLAIALKG
jgi:transcriptional regulator with XRE-family HTH domain